VKFLAPGGRPQNIVVKNIAMKEKRCIRGTGIMKIKSHLMK
jgi:hypothetical protein